LVHFNKCALLTSALVVAYRQKNQRNPSPALSGLAYMAQGSVLNDITVCCGQLNLNISVY